jgi:hypothetical protein
MAVAVLVLVILGALTAGCVDNGSTRLTVTFLVTGEERPYEFEVDCDSMSGSVPDPERVCIRISELGDVLFPRDVIACSLPVPTVYANVSGSYRGEELHLILAPCSDAADRALHQWRTLLGFERAGY